MEYLLIMVSGSAWCGRLTVTQEKGNTESDGFNSRRDRKLKLNASVAELAKLRPLKPRIVGSNPTGGTNKANNLLKFD